MPGTFWASMTSVFVSGLTPPLANVAAIVARSLALTLTEHWRAELQVTSERYAPLRDQSPLGEREAAVPAAGPSGRQLARPRRAV